MKESPMRWKSLANELFVTGGLAVLMIVAVIG